MTIDELHAAMSEGFQDVDQRFKAVDAEFVKVRGELRSEIQGLREELRNESGSLRSEVSQIRAEIKSEVSQIRTEIRAEGEATRRHFDVMVEKLEASVRVVAEATSHLTTVVNDHEQRLQAIEKST